MVKKLSSLIFAIFGSVLFLFGCGDPYKNLKLSVSTNDIVLYVNQESNEEGVVSDDNVEDNTNENVPELTYPSETSFLIKVSGAGKNVDAGVVISQYAYNGVEDIVKIEPVTTDTTSDEGARYKVTALRSGQGVIVVTTKEGNKREEIKVSVYVPIKSVSFSDASKAVKYGSSIDLNQFLVYNPTDTNQKEMQFYIQDETTPGSISDGVGVIETSYAKIENGVVYSKDSLTYPVNQNGQQYISVYAVSKYNANVKTEVIELPVLNIIEESDIDIISNKESGTVDVIKTSNGYYEIVLGGNIPNNPYIYSRNITLKLSEEYTIDQQYAITTNYDGVPTKNSVFELDNKVDEQLRYNFTGLKEDYPYKQFTFSQLKTGSDYLEIYVDRRGYEGLFTITLKFKITVKDFATSLSAITESGENAIQTGLVLYNAYGGNALGTSVVVNLSPNVNNAYKIRLSLIDIPQFEGVNGITMHRVDATEITSGTFVNGGTKIYLKHSYTYEQITEIVKQGLTPTLQISYIYNLAPISGMLGYDEYIISEDIPLVVKAGVTDIRIPANNQEIKINAVTGLAVNEMQTYEQSLKAENDDNTDEGTGEGGTGEDQPDETENEIILATIDNDPADLKELISSIKITSVNGSSSNIDAMNNEYFNTVYKEGPITGLFNRLVLEPKLQPNQAKIVVEITTNNNISKTVIIEIFVPIVYDVANANRVDVEIYNRSSVSTYIYEEVSSTYKVLLRDNLSIVEGDYEIPEGEVETVKDSYKYSTLDALTLSVNSRVGLNFYNYIVLPDSNNNPKITRVIYNSNVTLNQNREYYTIEYENVNGVQVPFIVTKNLKTNNSLKLEVKVVGYDNDGNEVTVLKQIDLNIIEPVTSISISPVSTTLYLADSLGALKEDASKLKYNLTVYPLNASGNAGTVVKYSLRDDVLYSRTGKNGQLYNITMAHFVSVNENTGEVQAKLKVDEFNKILNDFSIDTGISINANDVIEQIFANNVVATIYATLNQYNKPTISTSASITIKYATQVEKIIPSTSENGIYFDIRKTSQPNYKGETITFNVLPENAYNKTLIVTVGDESVIQIVSGVDKDHRMTGNSITIKPNINAGRTYIRISAEDSYVVDATSGMAVPSSYLDISVRVADGTKAYPFEINNANEFLEIGNDYVKNSNDIYENNYYYVLTQTFSISNLNFNPFNGVFNGGLSGNFTYDIAGITYSQQNVIYGLSMNKTITPTVSAGDENIYYYGIFKELGVNAEIENLVLSDVNLKFTITQGSASQGEIDFNDEINIGAIAGVNYGSILNSSVSGNIQVNSNIKNLNVGGFVGKNYSHFNVEFTTSSGTDENGSPATIVNNSKSSLTGIISSNVENETSFVSSQENSNVNIKFIGSSLVTDANINLGGVVGSVQTYATHKINGTTSYVGSYFGEDGLTMNEDVSVYQYFFKKTISNLVIASSVESVDENGNLYKANVGGVAGYANSTIFDNVNVLTSLSGHSNIGGVVGFASHSVVQNSSVEFANQGETGINTVSISGYTNVGGLIGYGKNVNVYFSYVRAYYNNQDINNSTYYGNMMLLESTENNKNIGGLIGYVDADEMSNQLATNGVSENFDISQTYVTVADDGTKISSSLLNSHSLFDYLNNKSANGIVKSYFNADINVSYQNLSGNVFVGGLVGNTTNEESINVHDNTKTVMPLQISNSYVYGHIKQADVVTYKITNKIEVTQDQKYLTIGTMKTYAIGNVELNGKTEFYNYDESVDDLIKTGSNLIEIITETTSQTVDETVDENVVQYQIQNITFKVKPIAQKLVGNQTFTISAGIESNKQTVVELRDSVAVRETTKTNTYTVQASTNNRAIEIEYSYLTVNGEHAIIEYAKYSNFDINNIVSNETIIESFLTYTTDDEGNLVVDDTNINKIEISNITNQVYVDLTNINNFTFFNIIEAVFGGSDDYKLNNWLICSDLNSGYPVLFKLEHNNGELLFKVLPTNIQITVNKIDVNNKFSNLSYIQDGENLVLLYNELTSGRAYKYVNYYKVVADGVGVSGNDYPLEAINVELDIIDLSQYGIIADYDKNMVITSSNPTILAVENNNLLVTKGVGKATLTISSKLDTSIYDTIDVLVVTGLSDYNIYKSKNLTTSQNTLPTISNSEDEIVDETNENATLNAITQIIDKVSNYYVDSVNEDASNLTDCNGVYVKNSGVGVKMEVSSVGNGQATINGKALTKGATYLFTSLNELSFVGTYEGLLYLKITPFIISNEKGFGQTLTQTDGTSIDNCILINDLLKVYKFNIKPKAESIALDKTSANLDPVKYVDVKLTTVTSDFVKTGEQIDVNEEINVTILDTINNTYVGSFILDMNNVGTNSSFINIEILNTYVNETEDDLKVELVYDLRFSFDAEQYKDRTGDVTYNLNEMAYKFNFYPTSNLEISTDFNIQIVPRIVTDVKLAYYPNAESDSSGQFFPQENESEYIVPSRVGLLKLELFPDFNNAEYVELTVNEEMKTYVNFSQQLAIMSADENSFVTGYRTIINEPDYLPNFKGIRLVNQSIIVNGSSVYYTGNYYVQIYLSEDAPINNKITFTATAYKTVNGEAVAITNKNIELTIQPLPTISLTINGQSEGIVAKGTEVELEINATNFEGDVEIAVSTLKGDSVNVSKRYDIALNKHFVNVGVNATAGDTVIIKATASRYLNGILEEKTSTATLFIVEYLLNGVSLEGSTYANGRYQYEALNGTTNMLNVVFDVDYNLENKAVASLKTALEQEASGKVRPSDAGGYINNWWRQIGNNEFESLYSNTNYGNYEFVDTKLSDLSETHYYGIKTISISSDNVLAYKMKYYYNSLGVPKLYTGTDYGFDIYELEFVFTLVIKDNSTYDHPNPISTVAEFMALGGLNVDGTNNTEGAVTEGHFILVNDLTLDNYYPFAANFSSLDGNGHVITINSINTEKYKTQTTGNNIGLFETVSSNTVLKNITIDIGNMLITTQMANTILKGQEENLTVHIDLSGVKSFNFGILAGQNNGSITNAKIINTKRTVIMDSAEKNLLINSTTGYIDGGLVDAKIGGLVAINNGSISNSYVGLNAENYGNEGSSQEKRSNVSEGSISVETYPFNLVAGKSVAGFVNTNGGILANNYVLGLGINNTGAIFDGTQTAGFVVENSTTGTVFNCMVEGLYTNNYRASMSQGVYIEAKGYIGGFVYTNAGEISNAYSNIPITTNSGGSGGFVYINQTTGKITNAYSTVENANNSLAHGQFTGIDDKNNFNNFGELTSCYYLVLEGETENSNEPATAIMGKKVVGDGTSEDETSNNNPFRDTGSFNGFNFATGNDENNIWRLSENTHFGPRLISANNVSTFSHRVLMHTTTDENTNETVYDYEYDSDCYYGSETNPLLVNTATEFVTFIINNSKTMTLNNQNLFVFGVTTSSKTAVNTPHYIRLINDLDFSSITLNNLVVDGKRISDITFVGKLDGNGMSMTGIRLVDQRQDTVHENFGLFSQVGLSEEQKNDENFGSNNSVSTAIMNINVTISGFDATQSVKVGALAGSMYNTSLINVTLNGGEGVEIVGRNIVGGIAGMILNSGAELITNVTTNNITVTASHRSESRVSEVTLVDEFGNPYNNISGTKVNLNFASYNDNKENSVSALRNYSYAGSIAGIIDASNRRAEDMGVNIKKTYSSNENITISDGKIQYPSAESNGTTTDVTQAKSSTEEINKHRTEPANNLVSKIVVQGGGFIAAEHAGGMFGYVGENTHIKNSVYYLGQTQEDKEEGKAFVQRIMGHNYAGAIVGENYGMLEQVYVEHLPEYQTEIDKTYGSYTQNANEISNLFGDSTSISIGAIAGFSSGSIILDSYSKIDVVNPKAKIAGGIVGLMAGTNYISHVFTTGNVYAPNRTGGLIGVYNALYIDDFITINEKTNIQEARPKLLLDYAFALNEWGTDVENVLYENLKEYYKSSSGDSYYDFEIRMPEVGNQTLVEFGAGGAQVGSTNTALKYSANFAGSLIGYVNTGSVTYNASSANKVEVSPSAILNKTLLNQVVSKSRKTSVVNNGQGERLLFSSVLSTTLNGSKITKNDTVYNDDSNAQVSDSYNQPLSKNLGDNGIGDKLEFENYIGNQFAIKTILGTDKQNATMFNMFIWDSVATGTKDFSGAGSQIWRIGDIFPEYIIGIYSNFNTLTSAEDLRNNISISNDTRNKFYLLNYGEYNMNSVLADSGRSDVFFNNFEGTLIGVTSEGKNPKIKLEIEPGDQTTTFFKYLNTATIMNVDFEINYVSSTGATNTLDMLDDNALLNNSYNGFFAKNVNSTVLSNINFNINFKTDKTIRFADHYKGVGLMIGYVNNSTLQNVNLNINNAQSVNSNPVLSRLTNVEGESISFGGVAAESDKTTFENVNVLSFNNTLVRLQLNNTNINVGNIVGLGNNVNANVINSINNQQVIESDPNIVLESNNISNNVFIMYDCENGQSVNMGGLFGTIYNTTINQAYFKGNLKFSVNANLNTNLNLGGAIGYGENSSVEHINVNDYLSYLSNGTAYRQVAQNQKIEVNNLTGASTSLKTNVGGVLGYGINFKVRGNTTNKLNTSNNTNIKVVASASSVNVGGVVGLIKNNNENLDVARVYNMGNLEVVVNNSNSNAVNVGGVVGNGVGGKYEALYNYGEINTTIQNPYAVGGIIGKAETTSSQTTLLLTKFINFANIYIGGNAPNATSTDKRIVGGVAGQIVGTGSKFEGGYTLARIFDSKNNSQFGINNQDNMAINGIAYASEINQTTFKNVYFVFDFLPYSNFTNSYAQQYGAKVIIDATSTEQSDFGGVEYAKLSTVLNNKLSSYFVTNEVSDNKFVVKNGTDVTKLNLPTIFKIDGASIDMFDALLLMKSSQNNDVLEGEKLNPYYINDTTKNEHIIENDKYYVMVKSAVDGDTIKLGSGEDFTGLLTSESRTDYPVIKLRRDAGGVVDKIVNNYGVLSNFAVRITSTNELFKGALVQNNYGNIINVVTYGYLVGQNLSFGQDVATFVYNNHANIVQSGSDVLILTNSLRMENLSFSGFVKENFKNAFIKDCYSNSSIINKDNDNKVLTNASSISGFANKNSGLIETSYYSGSLFATSVSNNVFVGQQETGAKIRNCFYDIEATPVTTGATNLDVNTADASKDITGVRYTRTVDFVSSGEKNIANSFLKTQFVPSNWTKLNNNEFAKYNFGYPVINGGIQLPTLFVGNSDNTQIVNSFVNSTTSSNKALFVIYHAGQMNVINNLNLNLVNANIALISNIDMSKVNSGSSNAGIFNNLIVLNNEISFYGLGHSINNLKITGSNLSVDAGFGLFANVASGSVIDNLNIVSPSVTISSSGNVGILVGINNGEIKNVTVKGESNAKAQLTATSSTNLGGVIGLNNSGKVSNVTTQNLAINGNSNVGGIVGKLNNGTLENLVVDSVEVNGQIALGGIVGYAKQEASSGIAPTITNVEIKGNSTIISGTGSASNFDTIRNTTYNWNNNYNSIATNEILNGNSNASQTGGAVGYLGSNAKLVNPKISKVEIVGYNVSGGVVGYIDTNGTVEFTNASVSSTKSNVKLNGSYNIGGIAGINKGSIKGASSKTSVYATVGTNQTSDKYNANIGGVVGNNLSGTISNIIVVADVYGSRLVGGIAGYTNNGRIENCVVSSTNIYYNSELDMDQHTGYMPDLYMGIGSQDANYKNNNFNAYLGAGGGDGAKGVFNCDKTIGHNVIEYGGIETKVAGNTKIPGKPSFKILVGFVAGATSGTVNSANVLNSQILNIYDTYRNYGIHVKDFAAAGTNNATLNRTVNVGTRTFNINSSLSGTTFYYGSNNYKKYSDEFENFVLDGSGGGYSYYNRIYYLETLTSQANNEKKEVLTYLKNKYEEYVKLGYYVESYKYLNLKDYSYPGMTWVDKGTLVEEKNFGYHTFYAREGWFKPIVWNAWSNVKFYSDNPDAGFIK